MGVKPHNTMTPSQHKQTSQRFIQQAAIELADDDLLQSSEKTWGAAAHAVKSIAERRGWQHNTHSRLFRIANRISRENHDPDIALLFRTASDSHKNFYEGWLNNDQVARYIERVQKLLEILEEVL